MNYTMEEIRLMALDMQRWKEEKCGKKLLTEQQFLDRYKTCDKCARQAVCRKMQFGYYANYDGEYGLVNRRRDVGTVQVCCVWDGATAEAVLDALKGAKERGEISGEK